MLKSILRFILILALSATSAYAGTITGNLNTPSGGAVVGGALTFTLSQAAILSGSASIVPSAVSCYTSTSGAIVGLPDPTALPVISANLGAGTLAPGTYYVKITYYNGSGESLASPESSFFLSGTGTLIVSAPVSQPASATGYKVYISSATGTETLQATQASWTNYNQASALSAGSALPSSNSSTCSIRFSDELIPSGTNYSVNLLNKNGAQMAGYPQTWYTFGGSGGTINVSNGTPQGGGAVIYPTPILATPSGGAGVPQSINGPLSLGAYKLSAGNIEGAIYADQYASLQAAHDAAVAAGFPTVMVPAGSYSLSSSLNVSPYVQFVSLGRVMMTTSLSSGCVINISDQYGKPSPDPNSTGLTLSQAFSGDFYLQNTNTSNTAISLCIGGATSANYASQMSIDGMNITGFKGGVIRFGYNAFLINFTHFFAVNNLSGGQISVLAGASNTGENISFDKCTFAGAGGSPAGFLMSLNTALPTSFTFHQCSFDYLAGLNDATQTAALSRVSMTDPWLEWDQTSAPYIDLNNGISFVLTNPYMTSTLVAGWNNPFVGRVTGTASSLRVIGGHYVFAPGVTTLYSTTSSSGRLFLDPSPNYQGGTAPTNYVSYAGSLNPRIFVSDAGQVGINNASPSQALDVNGSVGVSSQVIADNFVTRLTDMTFDSGTAARALIYKINGVEKGRFTTGGVFQASLFGTATNCASTGGTCSAAAAGSVTIAAAATTVTVSTTAVTANSQIILTRDNSLGARLSVTCNTQSSLVLGTPYVSARTAATSFVITLDVAPTTNPMCIGYQIIN